jgi:hydrogenase expression/formation protein HypC
MCVAIPYKLLDIKENGRAQIEVGGTRQEIGTLLVPEVKVGDCVLVYFGSATVKIDEDEVLEIIRLYHEITEEEMQ